MPTTVKEIMIKNPVTMNVPGTRTDLIKKMFKHNITGLPITKNTGEYLGMISRRDIFENPKTEQLALLIRHIIEPITSDTPIREAAKEMINKQRRHLPVLDKNKKVVGLVTPIEFMKAVAKKKLDIPVENYMHYPCLPIHTKTPIKIVFKAISLTKLNAFPVLNDEAKLVGLVTDRDIFKISNVDKSTAILNLGISSDEDAWSWDSVDNMMKLAYVVSNLELPHVLVEDVMIKDPKTLFSKTSISEAAEIMTKGIFSQLPLRGTHDELKAMLYEFDVIHALV